MNYRSYIFEARLKALEGKCTWFQVGFTKCGPGNDLPERRHVVRFPVDVTVQTMKQAARNAMKAMA